MPIKIKEHSVDKLFLSISIFYDRMEWHTLILRGILPFVEKTKALEGYSLALSKNRGDHVIFFLITSESRAEDLAEKANQYFNEIVASNRTKETYNLIPKNDFFCNFEPYTVQYGLYDGQFNSVHLEQELSKLVIYVFQKHGEETITNLTETMIEFFALFQEFSGFETKMVIQIFDNLLKNEYKKYNNTTLVKAKAILKKDFEHNKEEIISFLELRSWRNKVFEPHQEQWCVIVEQYQVSEPSAKTCVISAMCDVFDLEDRISAYYLFVNALKQLRE